MRCAGAALLGAGVVVQAVAVSASAAIRMRMIVSFGRMMGRS
jgi:hypothetical protein